MKNSQSIVLAISVCAGGITGLSAATETPTKIEPTRGTVQHVAHIYYNISTQERVITLLSEGQTAPADTGDSVSIWSSRVANPCAAQGFTTEHFFGLDNNSGSTSLATNAILSEWGDIELDSLVDCVHINWITDHDDVDNDSDGMGDGVEGLAGEWGFWDSDNGRPRCDRYPIVVFRFTDLPGDISGTSPDDPENTLAKYTVDVDLASAFTGTSLVFEIGDSDGDLQGANYGNNNIDIDSDGIGDGYSVGDMSTDGNGNPTVDTDFDGNPDWDLDLDGLFDWSWSVQFFQPGMFDHDDDGVIDGDIADSMRTIGISIASPAGEAIDNNDGTWVWEIDSTLSDSGTGSEDAYKLYDSNYTDIGVFYFGGLDCDANDQGQYTPRADFEMQLYGPSDSSCNDGIGCNPADLAEPCGVTNFFDVSAFLGFFADQDPRADFAEPFGVFNFFDVSAFLSAFNGGCP